MRALYRVLRRLWETPGAEIDPEAWATRFAAHMGLSAAVTTALLALLPAAQALAVSLAGYAAWELSQWRRARGWLLWWDCVADWTAWVVMALAALRLGQGDAASAAVLVLVAVLICAAGVWKRHDRF